MAAAGPTAEQTSSPAAGSDAVRDLRLCHEEEGEPDLESQSGSQELSTISETTEESSSMAGSKARGPCRCRPSRRCAAWAGSLAMLAVLLLFFFWVRKPTWEVRRIFVTQEVVNGLITAFTTPSGNGTAMFPIDASVDMSNGNFVGADVGAGEYVISYGEHVLARATSEPTVILRRSSGAVTVHAVSEISKETSEVLMKAVASSFTLTTNIKGQLPARSLGLTIKVGIECTVQVNVLALVSDPNKMVIGHYCDYSFGL